MAEYETVAKSAFKLKGVSDTGIKKKKKRKELQLAAVVEQKQVARSTSTSGQQFQDESPKEYKTRIQKTKAQLAFEKMQEKRQMQKILEKASKTHKQRVEEFNRHLDSLTEHYDIPKVSWTK